MSAQFSGAVLVRVSPEILEKLATEGSEPVVILGVEEAGDGTYDMTLKRPDERYATPGEVAQAFHEACRQRDEASAEVDRLRSAMGEARRLLAHGDDMAADKVLWETLRNG